MNYSILLQAANAMNAAYTTAPTWQELDGHVVHTMVNGINTFCWLGTLDFKEWILDDFNPSTEPDPGGPPIGGVHAPSLNNVMAILPSITACLDGLGKPPCYVIGHSKGAREAPLCHALLKWAGYRVQAGFFFEPPRVGGERLAKYLYGEDITMTQTWNAHGNDMVTLVPDGAGWVQAGQLARFQVPDSYGISDKHIMQPGVIIGITIAANAAIPG